MKLMQHFSHLDTGSKGRKMLTLTDLKLIWSKQNVLVDGSLIPPKGVLRVQLYLLDDVN